MFHFLNYSWLRLQEYGIANKMIRRLSPPFKSDDLGNNFQKIKFSNIVPVLIIFAIGALLAITFFLFETIYSYIKN